jgi:hypothetical protein
MRQKREQTNEVVEMRLVPIDFFIPTTRETASEKVKPEFLTVFDGNEKPLISQGFSIGCGGRI